MKHFGIFILFVVTLIQYGYGEGEEATQGAEGETVQTNTECECPAEVSETQSDGVVTECETEQSVTECECPAEASETQSGTLVTECETEPSVAENGNLNEASEGKEQICISEGDVTSMKSQTPSFPDIVEEVIVPTNAPPFLGVEKALHTWQSRVTTKPPDSPELCQRPLTPRWPTTITRPSPFPSSKFQTQFTSHEYNFHHSQSQEQWSYTLGNQNNVNRPSWPSCTVRPLPETPGSIIMRSRLSRCNNMNPPSWNGPLGDGCANRMPFGYSGYRTPPTYFGPRYSNFNEMQRPLDVTGPWKRPQSPPENTKGKPGVVTKIMDKVKGTMDKIKGKFAKKNDKKPEEPQPMLCECCNRLYLETTTKKPLARKMMFWKK